MHEEVQHAWRVVRAGCRRAERLEMREKRRKEDTVLYTVGTTAALQRQVCRHGFLANYPVSPSTLNRMIERKAAGLPAYEPKGFSTPAADAGEVAQSLDRVADKALSVIMWWLAYADMASEKLPDTDKLMTPHRYMCDIYDV
eukprot:4541107-Pleurochrysis_carterae.AAC.2